MARNLSPDRERATIAAGAAVVALAMSSALGQIGAIALVRSPPPSFPAFRY
jgi:chromate transporter